ncbi:MAG: ABC transporter ATP-binding protein [Bacillota bacterium]|nr:ABC transporter ATP-binding protein [Bacillota bacterium]
MNQNLISIKNLEVIYKSDYGVAKAVNNIGLELQKGKTLGIVGETGAGKTTTALSIMGLLPEKTSKILNGEITFNGKNLLSLTNKEMTKVRGDMISMIFQDPMSSLNPVINVGEQIAEVLELHTELSKKERNEKVDEMLNLVGISNKRKNEYPHQFSGGMKQRVVIAMALACNPKLLIADEPTTALDVTIQAQILEMINDLKSKFDTSIIMITHDLGVVAQMCDDVSVMYAGEIIETGTAKEIFESKYHHPYTIGLFKSIPNLTKKTKRLHPIEGLIPDPMRLPEGCKFSPRCPEVMDICKLNEPDEVMLNNHKIKCHLFSDK